jgi:ribosome-binding factor A
MTHRLQRVNGAIARELGALIQREIEFPVPLVTVHAVDVTPDLKQAHVFISAMAEGAVREEILSILEKKRPLLQSALAKRVILKNTPHLHFRFDESIERGSRVLGILDELGFEKE